MPKLIYKYSQIKDNHTVRDVEIFNESENSVEPLCEIDGFIYATIESSVDITSVDAGFGLQLVTLTKQMLEQIKARSSACKLIKTRRQARLDAAYDLQDRLFLSELSQGVALQMIEMTAEIQQQLQDYKEKVQECNTWASAAYAELGLVTD